MYVLFNQLFANQCFRTLLTGLGLEPGNAYSWGDGINLLRDYIIRDVSHFQVQMDDLFSDLSESDFTAGGDDFYDFMNSMLASGNGQLLNDCGSLGPQKTKGR